MPAKLPVPLVDWACINCCSLACSCWAANCCDSRALAPNNWAALAPNNGPNNGNVLGFRIKIPDPFALPVLGLKGDLILTIDNGFFLNPIMIGQLVAEIMNATIETFEDQAAGDEIISAMFYGLMTGMRRHFKDGLNVIDATPIRTQQWAEQW